MNFDAVVVFMKRTSRLFWLPLAILHIDFLRFWEKLKYQHYFDSKILLFSDAPCKTLFIDYRGLQTLGHWMTELQGQNELELNLMESVVDVLAVLSIPDRQVLNETGIWQIISKLDAGADVEVINEVSTGL